MRTLLLIAHGSRREASNEELRELAKRLASLAAPEYSTVVPAFLELADPDIPTGVDRCVEAGATQVIAVPYFLAAGRHVVVDIPKQLAKAQQRHPGLDLRQSDYLGLHDSLPGLLLDLARGSAAKQAPEAPTDDPLGKVAGFSLPSGVAARADSSTTGAGFRGGGSSERGL